MTLAAQTIPDGTRPRPALHFTATDGWVNDPYGIAWVDDRYHLYYQTVPGQVLWGPNCRWGHAVSEDLVQWVEQPLALEPQPYEVGCWSGSVVHAADPPLLFYTRVAGDDLELGQAATAELGADGHWHTAPENVVVDGPPPGLGVRCFRDPNVLAHEDGWVMLMATALDDGVAAVLQYRSPDLQTWEYDGVLCSRRSERTDEVWTGTLWECPQLFRVGDRWVLLVSVWEKSTLYHVAAAVGVYDGHTFTPESWQQLSYGSSAYAMAAFTDRDGRACVMSWLREEPQNNPDLVQRAGAHSVPAVVTLTDDGRLRLDPHPNLSARRQAPLPADHLEQPAQAGQAGQPEGPERWTVGAGPVQVTFHAAAGTRLVVHEPGHERATLEVAQGAVTLSRPGLSDQSQPVVSGEEVTLLLDADIAEIFTASSYAAYRIAPAALPTQTRLHIEGATGLQVQPLATGPG